uniref:Uncharacterized protein n=1 Tax=Rhizophora mucronata TaxID=61149 RepID=A0A2P2M2A6_RHIMU
MLLWRLTQMQKLDFGEIKIEFSLKHGNLGFDIVTRFVFLFLFLFCRILCCFMQIVNAKARFWYGLDLTSFEMVLPRLKF